MQKASVEELKGQIAAGQYAIDTRVLAGDIISKFALIRRVARLLIGEDERDAADEAGRGAQPRQRGSAPASRRSSQRNERLP